MHLVALLDYWQCVSVALAAIGFNIISNRHYNCYSSLSVCLSGKFTQLADSLLWQACSDEPRHSVDRLLQNNLFLHGLQRPVLTVPSMTILYSHRRHMYIDIEYILHNGLCSPGLSPEEARLNIGKAWVPMTVSNQYLDVSTGIYDISHDRCLGSRE